MQQADSFVIKVHFLSPRPDGRTEFYFSSLAAIFDTFTADDIGCKLETLWACKIGCGIPKVTAKCIVSRHPVFRKTHKGVPKRD